MNLQRWTRVAALLAVLAASQTGFGQFRRFMMRPQPVGQGGVVNLPYMTQDNSGGSWRIYQNGWLQQQGNMPVYSQGATLMINGNQPQQNTNQARIDDKTGELVFDNLQAAGLNVTRRISFEKDGSVRYIDIFKNTQAQDQTVNVMIQSNLNYGINNSQMVADPKKKDQNIAWVAQTGVGPSAVEMFAGKNAKVAPTIVWPQGNSYVQANLSLAVPVGKEVAFMHIHCTAASQDAGVQFVNNLKETQLMKSIPIALRKLIVNFPTGQGFIGDFEILRGDLQDVVELRGGDQFRGALQEKAYDLQTFYGPVQLPVDRVIGIINVGQFRPRQLLVTVDGQIFGGYLKKETLDIQLASGQITQIPLSQVSRAGYRKRANEPEEWTFNNPIVLMRSGERVGVQMPAEPVPVQTRYGKLDLKPEALAAIFFQNEDNGVHEILLTDGSRFAGLVLADMFSMKLDAAADQVVQFPASSISRWQLTPKVAEVDDLTPTLKLANEDLLVGTLTGKLKLQTAFDSITVTAGEIRGMTHAKESPLDVQVTLWDGTTLSGQLDEPELACNLTSGVSMKIPVALLEEYSQPQPQPSPSMVEKIKSVIADLGSDDWKKRDRAQAQLVSMGPVAAGALKQLRQDQPPEAQKTIDIVLKELEKLRVQQNKAGAAAAHPAPGGPTVVPQPAINDLVLPQ